MSFLERLVEEQKHKRRFSNKDLIKRLSGNMKLFEDGTNPDEVLNESFPAHFGIMKTEDSVNEKRPD